MTRFFAMSLIAAASLGLAACSEQAQDESAEAANVIGGDVEATMESAGDTVDGALSGAEQSMDNAGTEVEGAAEGAADATGNAMVEAGEEVREN